MDKYTVVHLYNEFYSAKMKRNELLIYATAQMRTKIIILSKRSHKTKICTVIHLNKFPEIAN